jgi:hypothetical protein
MAGRVLTARGSSAPQGRPAAVLFPKWWKDTGSNATTSLRRICAPNSPDRETAPHVLFKTVRFPGHLIFSRGGRREDEETP